MFYLKILNHYFLSFIYTFNHSSMSEENLFELPNNRFNHPANCYKLHMFHLYLFLKFKKEILDQNFISKQNYSKLENDFYYIFLKKHDRIPHGIYDYHSTTYNIEWLSRKVSHYRRKIDIFEINWKCIIKNTMFNLKNSGILFHGNYFSEHEVYLFYEADIFNGYFCASCLVMGDDEDENEEGERQ